MSATARSPKRLSVFAAPLVGVLIAGLVSVSVVRAQDKPAPPPASQPATKADVGAKPAAGGKLVELELRLPKPAFRGTPTHIPPGTNLETPRKGPRPPLMVPPGTKLLSAGKPVTSSDTDPIIGHLKMVTDGEKDAKEGTYVELGPRLQWVQLDLKDKYALQAVVVWHYHANPRVYHDVVVQVADDADFIENVRTIYNNDHDNSSGLGLGSEKEYWDTYEGRVLDAKGVAARYVRLYSNGSTADDQNHYTEVEVFGTPAK